MVNLLDLTPFIKLESHETKGVESLSLLFLLEMEYTTDTLCYSHSQFVCLKSRKDLNLRVRW